ncbi:MAG TPA: cohesin domain-containing protein [Candidatus Acidoferrales bacterium]|nr:cohesin domain-containing protein [Candidatus Acidoferrales bacterium]HTS66398.1 cohesin domain-containing protein [Candidatus Acidoferrales bacterium]
MNLDRKLPFLAVQAAVLVSAPLLTAEPVISPGSVTVSNGVFSLPVSITGASDVYAFQFDLAFDPYILTLLSISEGSFLPTGGPTTFVPGTIDNTVGTAANTADTLTGPVPGATGDGVLADFEFEATGAGTSPITLSNGILLDSSLSGIPFMTSPGSVTVPAVPEPPGLTWIGALGLAGLLLVRRRRLAPAR